MNERAIPRPEFYLETKNYLQFVEFCETCRTQKTIGLSIGRPGVGKTEAARRYANWDVVEPNVISVQRPLNNPEELVKCSKLLFLPNITVSAPKLKNELGLLRNRFDSAIERSIAVTSPEAWVGAWRTKHIDLVIIDEAYRLRYEALEELRDLQEKWRIGVVLIGDPGMDRRLDRQPHFSHRVMFLHEYQQLSLEDASRYIDYKVEKLGAEKPPSDVYSAIYWYTQGNFRMLNNLFLQIERLLKINEMSEVSRDIVDSAREVLLFGFRQAANTAR